MANDIYIIQNIFEVYCSIVSQKKSKFSLLGIIRFFYILVSIMTRLSFAFFSTAFSIFIMAKNSDFFQEHVHKHPYLCGHYTFLVVGILWATVLLWSFHRSGKNPDCVFIVHQVAWVNGNLMIASVLMFGGIVSTLLFGQELEIRFIALSGTVMFGIFFLIIVNTSNSNSSGSQLFISLIVFLTVGLPFLAFIQPIVALSQIDNFQWGTREKDSSKSVLKLGNTQREKVLFILLVYVLNSIVFFGIYCLRKSDWILVAFCVPFIAGQLFQLLFGIIRNVQLNRERVSIQNRSLRQWRTKLNPSRKEI